jgi:hypothetical protein
VKSLPFLILLTVPLAGTLHRSSGQSRQEPQELAPGIISTGHEFTVTFAPGAREVFFTRSFPEIKVNRVMRSEWKDGAWQTAVPVSFSSDSASDLDPALSPDGQRLYFVSTRARPAGHASPQRDMDIWYADRTSAGWGEPEWIEELSSDGKEGSPTVDRNGTLCFFSDREAAANHNAIYCATRTASGFSSPVRQNDVINAGPSDTSPFLTPDGKSMLWYSTRPGGFGQADLYVSRKSRGEWGVAVNIGAPINTEAFEYNPSLSPDRRTLYFGRSGRIWEVPAPGLAAIAR